MKKELNDIIILPALFLRKNEDGKSVIRCLLDNNHTEDRIFDEYSTRGIENPKYLFIGIMTGVGLLQFNFIDGNEYSKMFEKKWKILTK